MTSKVQKWGNSLALRIPHPLAEDIQLRQGSQVEIKIVNGQMVVTPTEQKKYSLSELLAGITESNLHAETDWSGAVGQEVW